MDSATVPPAESEGNGTGETSSLSSLSSSSMFTSSPGVLGVVDEFNKTAAGGARTERRPSSLAAEARDEINKGLVELRKSLYEKMGGSERKLAVEEVVKVPPAAEKLDEKKEAGLDIGEQVKEEAAAPAAAPAATPATTEESSAAPSAEVLTVPSAAAVVEQVQQDMPTILTTTLSDVHSAGLIEQIKSTDIPTVVTSTVVSDETPPNSVLETLAPPPPPPPPPHSTESSEKLASSEELPVVAAASSIADEFSNTMDTTVVGEASNSSPPVLPPPPADFTEVPLTPPTVTTTTPTVSSVILENADDVTAAIPTTTITPVVENVPEEVEKVIELPQPPAIAEHAVEIPTKAAADIEATAAPAVEVVNSSSLGVPADMANLVNDEKADVAALLPTVPDVPVIPGLSTTLLRSSDNGMKEVEGQIEQVQQQMAASGSGDALIAAVTDIGDGEKPKDEEIVGGATVAVADVINNNKEEPAETFTTNVSLPIMSSIEVPAAPEVLSVDVVENQINEGKTEVGVAIEEVLGDTKGTTNILPAIPSALPLPSISDVKQEQEAKDKDALLSPPPIPDIAVKAPEEVVAVVTEGVAIEERLGDMKGTTTILPPIPSALPLPSTSDVKQDQEAKDENVLLSPPTIPDIAVKAPDEVVAVVADAARGEEEASKEVKAVMAPPALPVIKVKAVPPPIPFLSSPVTTTSSSSLAPPPPPASTTAPSPLPSADTATTSPATPGAKTGPPPIPKPAGAAGGTASTSSVASKAAALSAPDRRPSTGYRPAGAVATGLTLMNDGDGAKTLHQTKRYGEETAEGDEQPAQTHTKDPYALDAAVGSIVDACYYLNGNKEQLQLTFRVGDKITILEKADKWSWGRLERTGEEGFFPHNYVQSTFKPLPGMHELQKRLAARRAAQDETDAKSEKSIEASSVDAESFIGSNVAEAGGSSDGDESDLSKKDGPTTPATNSIKVAPPPAELPPMPVNILKEKKGEVDAAVESSSNGGVDNAAADTTAGAAAATDGKAAGDANAAAGVEETNSDSATIGDAAPVDSAAAADKANTAREAAIAVAQKALPATASAGDAAGGVAGGAVKMGQSEEVQGGVVATATKPKTKAEEDEEEEEEAQKGQQIGGIGQAEPVKAGCKCAIM